MVDAFVAQLAQVAQVSDQKLKAEQYKALLHSALAAQLPESLTAFVNHSGFWDGSPMG